MQSDVLLPQKWVSFCDEADELRDRLEKVTAPASSSSDRGSRVSQRKMEFTTSAQFELFAVAQPHPDVIQKQTKGDAFQQGDPPHIVRITRDPSEDLSAGEQLKIVALLADDGSRLEELLGPCVGLKAVANAAYTVRQQKSEDVEEGSAIIMKRAFVLALCDLKTSGGRAMYSFATTLADVVIDATRHCEEIRDLLLRASVVHRCVSSRVALSTYGRPYLVIPGRSRRSVDEEEAHHEFSSAAATTTLSSSAISARFIGAFLGPVMKLTPPKEEAAASTVLQSSGFLLVDAIDSIAWSISEPVNRSFQLATSREGMGNAKIPLDESELADYITYVADSVLSDGEGDCGDSIELSQAAFAQDEKARYDALEQLLRQLAEDYPAPCKELAQAYRELDLGTVLASLPGGGPTPVSWSDDDVKSICGETTFWPILSESLVRNMRQGGGFMGRRSVGDAPQSAPKGSEQKLVYQHALSGTPFTSVDDMSNHHIIPKDDMAFLWDYFHNIDTSPFGLRGGSEAQLEEKRRQLELLDGVDGAFHLLLLPFSPPPVAQRTHFVWAVWNLFQGPSCALRADDPSRSFRSRLAVSSGHQVGDVERRRPSRFSRELWDLVQGLYETVAVLQARARLARLLDESGKADLFRCEQEVGKRLHALATEWKKTCGKKGGGGTGQTVVHRFSQDEWVRTETGQWKVA